MISASPAIRGILRERGDARRVGEGGAVVDDANVAETGRLFVRNLPYVCTEEDVATLFKAFGPLSEVC